MLKLSKLKRLVILIASIIVLFVCIYLYWIYRGLYPSTDNAYVGAHIVQIAAQVEGPIIKLYVKNHQFVKKGVPLFDIDPKPFAAALEKAEAQLDLAKQKVLALEQKVKIAEALVVQRQAELILMQKNFSRIMTLVKKHQASLSEGDEVTSRLAVANSVLNEVKNRLAEAKAELGDEGNNAELRSAQAELEQAKLNLQYTHVIAPVDGFIMNLTARIGTMVQAGVFQFAIIDNSQWWVDANYKETDLKRVRVGQPAEIEVDIYPDYTFHGIVESISYGSGAAFSIFPAENATGNWVKVTQRFAVRIHITDPNPTFPLRVGASATVTINTRHK